MAFFDTSSMVMVSMLEKAEDEEEEVAAVVASATGVADCCVDA